MTTTDTILPARYIPGPGKIAVTMRIEGLFTGDLLMRFVDPTDWDPENRDVRLMAAEALLAMDLTTRHDGRRAFVPDETLRLLRDYADDRGPNEDRLLVSVDGVCILDEWACDAYEILDGWSC